MEAWKSETSKFTNIYGHLWKSDESEIYGGADISSPKTADISFATCMKVGNADDRCDDKDGR